MDGEAIKGLIISPPTSLRNWVILLLTRIFRYALLGLLIFIVCALYVGGGGICTHMVFTNVIMFDFFLHFKFIKLKL